MTQPQTGKKTITSDSGWQTFARVLTESAPAGLAQSQKARAAIHRLIRSGR